VSSILPVAATGVARSGCTFPDASLPGRRWSCALRARAGPCQGRPGRFTWSQL